MLSILSAIGGILISFFVARYYYRLSVRKNLAVYLDLDSRVLERIEPTMRSQLLFRIGDTEVRDLRQSEFVVVNDGKKAIRDCIQPLSVELPRDVKVLDASILYRSPEDLAISVFEDKAPSGSSILRFEFPLLNKEDFFRVKLLADGVFNPLDLRFKILVDDLPRTIAVKRSFVRIREIAPRQGSPPLDYVALAIATCGVGYLPLAPGTWGSLVGFGAYGVAHAVAMKLFFAVGAKYNLNLLQVYYGVIVFEVVVVIAISLVGTWAASRTERLSGRKDPGKVVIDEVAGQFIALMSISFFFETALWSAFLAFLLFRFFDIVKPYPARKLESLEAGLGIMADDIVAGVYAGIVVALAVVVSWFI